MKKPPHPHPHGRGMNYNVGSRHVKAKLTEDQVREIRALVASGRRPFLRVLAAKYGVATSTMATIVRGERWKHVTA